MVYLFLFSTLIPIHFAFGSVVIHSYRVALLIAFFPSVFRWISGKAGKIQLPDILILLFVVWASLALINAHGMEAAVQPSGVVILESFGAYVLARAYIRTPADFARVARAMLLIVTVLVPFAAVETFTGRNLIVDLLQPVFNVSWGGASQSRWGLFRARTTFQHPIHFGVFCASGLGLIFYAIARNPSFLGRAIRAAPLGVGTFLSLSTGALTAFVAQASLIGWDIATRRISRRWAILGGLAVAAYVAIDLLSNRSPFHVFATYLSFNIDSGYARIHIWNHGTASVAEHPFFGIGFGDWDRPHWMSGSVDNFWLVIPMQFGLPALALFATAVLLTMYRIGRAGIADEEAAAYRKGLLITLAGLIIAGATVHYWNILYALFLFLLGSGSWVLQSSREAAAGQSTRRNRGASLQQQVADAKGDARPMLKPGRGRRNGQRHEVDHKRMP